MLGKKFKINKIILLGNLFSYYTNPPHGEMSFFVTLATGGTKYMFGPVHQA